MPPEVDDTLFVHKPPLSKVDTVATMRTKSHARGVFARVNSLAIRQSRSFHLSPNHSYAKPGAGTEGCVRFEFLIFQAIGFFELGNHIGRGIAEIPAM